MHVLVDLAACQSYGQCVYAAPEVFRLAHEEVLEWDYAPSGDAEEPVRRAAHACPVGAITFSSGGEAGDDRA
ncbi:ferredoxin [Lentzea sp. NPDC060358]|uniref:ferredoxin n=1 Tax=Lentzea sp. NPDC060358 TaxID=3347103 RepID=UPI0036469428